MKRREQNHRKLREKILSDKSIRRAVVRRSHYWFFSIFLSHYIQYEIAPFQREMFALTEDKKNRLAIVMAFRGSGKSTIMNLSYTLWAILGVQQKKFVLIISKTQSQAKNHFLNIRDELKRNDLLAKDLGPFDADESNWGMSSLVLPKMGARITVASKEQAIRGIRFWQHRPDLIICDDLEDSTSAQSKMERDETYRWFMSEVVLAGDGRAKIIVLGNLLGKHSLLLRLQEDIESGKADGVFRAYPLLDDYEQVLWPGKYQSKERIEDLRVGVPDNDAWEIEYMLKYVPEISLIKLAKIRDGKLTVAAREPYRLGPYVISAPVEKSVFKSFSKETDWNSSGPLVPPSLAS